MPNTTYINSVMISLQLHINVSLFSVHLITLEKCNPSIFYYDYGLQLSHVWNLECQRRSLHVR